MTYKWLLALFVLYLGQARSEFVHQTSKMDVLNNPQLRKSHIKCFLGKGPCVDADSKYLKDNIPDLFLDYCQRCTDAQVRRYFVGMLWYAVHDPDNFKLGIDKIKGEWVKLGKKNNKKLENFPH